MDSLHRTTVTAQPLLAALNTLLNDGITDDVPAVVKELRKLADWNADIADMARGLADLIKDEEAAVNYRRRRIRSWTQTFINGGIRR